MSEEYRKDNHIHEWLQDGPQPPQNSLLVPYLDIPHDKKAQQFSVIP
jgi:hypothetical protein